MTNLFSADLPEPNWASRLGASCLPSASYLGTSVPAAGPVTIAPPALPRLRVDAAARVLQAQKVAVTAQVGAAQVGQTNIHNYMTTVFTVGEGASGPPRARGPV